jgi:uncharacterized protein YecE (DUF72 family)
MKICEKFCELMKPLQEIEKLACILIQLPPGMKFKKDRIEAFLKILPQDLRFALEYRNETWLTQEVHDLLSEYNVATVAVDEPLLPPDIRLTSDIAYVRWHGRGKKMWYNYRYSKDELSAWVPKVKEMIELNMDKIIADVRGYSVYIDVEKRFILHDCGDWRRTQRDRRFCKHIGALMLALPEDAARGVLLGIKREKWEFSQYTE